MTIIEGISVPESSFIREHVDNTHLLSLRKKDKFIINFNRDLIYVTVHY